MRVRFSIRPKKFGKADGMSFASCNLMTLLWEVALWKRFVMRLLGTGKHGMPQMSANALTRFLCVFEAKRE